MLGRTFTIIGTVEHGQHLARTLGFPTANITLPLQAALPCPGVYEITATLQGKLHRGIANIGTRPTVDEVNKKTLLEAHFPRWSGDLYGESLSVSLIRFLRPERRFPDLSALRTQIVADIASLDL